MKRTKYTLLCALLPAALLLHLSSCRQEKPAGTANTRHAVQPNLVDDVPFQDFDVEVATGDTIRLPEGTNIYIAPDLFVDAAGKPVKGKVQLHYRAFYTPGQIVASGITMNYDTAGQPCNFVSAGMFQLYGTQDGKPISIAPGKTIEMDFASTSDDPRFSFYELDTASAKWAWQATGTADSNSLFRQLEKELAQLPKKPVQPMERNPSQPVINIDVDMGDHPELAGYTGVVWQYAGNGENPEKNSWIYSTPWTSATVTAADSNSCTYEMTLQNNSKRFSTNVFPVLEGKNYKQALAEFKTKMAAFDASEKERQEKRKRLAETPVFKRQTYLTRFGFFNWDCTEAKIFKKLKRIFGIFHFSDPVMEKNRDNFTVFVVAYNGRLTSYGNGSLESNIVYSEDENTCIIAVEHGTSRAAVLSSGEFKEMAVSLNGKATSFTLRPTTHPVASSKDFDDLVSKL